MDEERLYEVIDFILNQASDSEIEVIVAALKRRLKDTLIGDGELNPGKMARTMASSVGRQVHATSDQIRKMVKDFVAELIKKNAPEISEKELQTLLETWVPDRRLKGSLEKEGEIAGTRKDTPESPEADVVKSNPPALPKDVLLTMIRQFVSYSTGVMSVTEQAGLNEDIPDWKAKYWERFPYRIKKILSLYLKGQIDEQACWQRISSELTD
ncbi:MAG: hypothetical protein AB1798_19515 [Spirochaetota bacterium]